MRGAVAAAPKAPPVAAPPATPGDVSPAAAAAPAAVPGTATPPEVAVVETEATLEKAKADLEIRIAALAPKLGQARSKIAALVRGVVDQQMIPPAGGKIEGGQIYRREVHNDWNYYGPYYWGYNYGTHYEYVPIGPAVKKGDYRSQQEKDAAIQKAKEETLPMEQEMKSLQAELAATKLKLAKLRAGKAGT